MKFLRLISRSTWWYRRSWFRVMAGIILGTGVLTGGLLVGDSVRGSLARMVDQRLGETKWAIPPSGRFFRKALATDLQQYLHHPVIPALLTQGIAIQPEAQQRVNHIQVVGIDSTFFSLWKQPVLDLGPQDAIISENLSVRLDAKIGDPLLIRLPASGNTPKNAPFVASDEPNIAIRLVIKSIASDNEMGRFGLQSDQKAPYNLFLSYSVLAEKLGITGRVNLMLLPDAEGGVWEKPVLQEALKVVWQAEDAGLDFVVLDDTTLQINTERIFFDESLKTRIGQSDETQFELLTYLANSLIHSRDTTPYSFVTALKGGPPWLHPKPGHIIVTDWLANDLNVGMGDTVSMIYFVMGPFRRLKEEQVPMIVSGVVPLQKIPSGAAMMPDFPGMSDAGSCRNWETGAPVDLERIRDKDEAFWNQYQGTPKAFISMQDGARLWENPYGVATAIRVHDPDLMREKVVTAIMENIDPQTVGLLWVPVWEAGKKAAANSVDFGELFLSLSFFLIVASLLLTGLLYGDYLRIRMKDIPLLISLGFDRWKIIGIFFREGLLMAILGTLLGVGFGILVNEGILAGLNTLWNDAVPSSSLHRQIHLQTLIIGGGTSLLLILFILTIAMIRRLNKPVQVLFALETQWLKMPLSGKRWVYYMGMVLVTVAVSFTIWLVWMYQTDQSTWFLVSGALILFGGWLMIKGWLIGKSHMQPGHSFDLRHLRKSNLSLFRRRNNMAILLMALGTFVIVITGANRKTFLGTETSRSSGTGGFLFWGETTHPVLVDLNDSDGKKRFLLQDEPCLDSVWFLQFHLLEGNDASCLNLNQVSNPRILGVPAGALDQRKAFSFSVLGDDVDSDHPWSKLNHINDSSIIPAFADQTVITWGLMKKVGDTLQYLDEAGNPFSIVLVGGLQSSVFQGHILISDQIFKKKFPSVSGSKVMLIEGNPAQEAAIAQTLEARFPDYGIFLTKASRRLAAFYSVTNTYLSIFMLLGALGILIGTIGFGVVIYQNVMQRKQELALYLALGFPPSRITSMLVREFILVLVMGMGLGITGAFIGLLPSLLTASFEVPLVFLVTLIAILFFHGWLWVVIPVKIALKQAIIPALKRE